MPHEAIADITQRAMGGLTTCRPVSGLRPKLARVAAMTAMSKAVTDAAHWRKYASVATSSLEPSTPCASPASSRLRSPVASSERKTASSTARVRPANAPRPSRIVWAFCCAVAPSMRDATTIAPALIIGFIGRPPSKLASLKASPLGSTPTCVDRSATPRASRASA